MQAKAGDKVIRFVMRQEKTLKVVANHVVPPDVKLESNLGSDRSWVWVSKDFSDPDDTNAYTFAIKFRTVEAAEEFKSKFESAQENNKKVVDAAKPSKDGDDERESTEAAAETPAAKPSAPEADEPAASSETPADKEKPAAASS